LELFPFDREPRTRCTAKARRSKPPTPAVTALKTVLLSVSGAVMAPTTRTRTTMTHRSQKIPRDHLRLPSMTHLPLEEGEPVAAIELAYINEPQFYY
jgi:hypothetical protein